MTDPNAPPPGEPNQPSWDAPPAAPTQSWDAPPVGQPEPQSWAPPSGMAPAGPSSVPGILDPGWQNGGATAPAGWEPKQKMIAGILGILIGSLGIHSFYLGNSKKGIIQIIATVVTCGMLGIWGFIEGIMILVGSIKTDAYGVPLTE